MAIEVLMPRLSDTMEEGKLLKWLKKVGDKIEVGDIIAEVETDKADMEMEALTLACWQRSASKRVNLCL